MPAVPIGGVITTVTFKNRVAQAKPGEPITFGHVFKAGDLPPLNVAVDLFSPSGIAVPCQFNVKNFHKDGSVRFATLSAIIPIGASAIEVYSIRRAASGPSGVALVPANFPGLSASVLVTDTGTALSGPIVGNSYVGDAAAKLAAGEYEIWLSGPIVSEWIVRLPLMTSGGVEHPDLHGRARIRAYGATGHVKIDYTVENNFVKAKAVPDGSGIWQSNISSRTNVFRFSLKANNTTVYSHAIKGHVYTPMSNINGVFGGNATGLPNDSNPLTATLTIDGVPKAISITGMQAQNYSELTALLIAQMGGMATVEIHANNKGYLLQSVTTGANSSVVLDPGTLFPALGSSSYRSMFGDETVLEQSKAHKLTFWVGIPPTVHVAFNKAYWVASKAVPNYKASLVGDRGNIDGQAAAMAANSALGKNGITKAYFADVGFAPGIGILPEWVSVWFISQDEVAKDTMLKQADLSSGWSIMVRDYNTDRPISFTDYPYATGSPNIGDSVNPATGFPEKFPAGVATPGLTPNVNAPDGAHCPDFNFMAALVTGDHFYMEMELFYQRYTCLGNAANTYRDGRKCLWRRDQVRSQAWALRTALHAMYLLPTNYPLKNDLQYILDQNRLYFIATYATPGGSFYNQLGAMTDEDAVVYYGGLGVGLFQDDFMTAAAGRAVELGFTEWKPWLEFKAKFVIGRLTSGLNYCWQLGSSTMAVVVRSANNTPIFTTFAEVYQASFSPAILAAACGSPEMQAAMLSLEGSRNFPNIMAGYPDIIGGYPSNSQPAIAYAASYDVPGGDDAWIVFEGRGLKPNYNVGAQFAIEPRATELDYAPPDTYSGNNILYFGRSA